MLGVLSRDTNMSEIINLKLLFQVLWGLIGIYTVKPIQGA